MQMEDLLLSMLGRPVSEVDTLEQLSMLLFYIHYIQYEFEKRVSSDESKKEIDRNVLYIFIFQQDHWNNN